jgi:ketosteroid isomerase-like protein
MSQGSTDVDIDVVQEMYRAFARGDAVRTLELCAPDVRVHQSPALPWGGDHVGHDGVLAFLTALGGALDSAPQTERLYADGAGTVVQVGRTRGTVRATGVPFDVPETHLWRIRDGRVVGFEAYLDTAAMLAALAAVDTAGALR